jgi:hypothetical protein
MGGTWRDPWPGHGCRARAWAIEHTRSEVPMTTVPESTWACGWAAPKDHASRQGLARRGSGSVS